MRVSERDPPRWEYRALRPPREETKKEATDPTDALNDLGADGWEVADTIDYVGGGTKYILLKRPRDDATEARDD